MPTYEYECTVCGHVFDVFHSMTAKPRVKCPECKGRAKKKFGIGAGIIFKGSGFYETDYRRKPEPKETRAEGEAGKAPSGDAKKEEKKPAASNGD